MARKETILELRKILLRRREALRQALAGDLSLLNELREQSSGDMFDFASDSASGEINCQLAEVESRELEEIDEALRKIAEGTYGKCDDCGKPINVKRLQALPYATECIDCKRKAESLRPAPGWRGARNINYNNADIL
jgi:DnaK suppressor protein